MGLILLCPIQKAFIVTDANMFSSFAAFRSMVLYLWGSGKKQLPMLSGAVEEAIHTITPRSGDPSPERKIRSVGEEVGRWVELSSADCHPVDLSGVERSTCSRLNHLLLPV